VNSLKFILLNGDLKASTLCFSVRTLWSLWLKCILFNHRDRGGALLGTETAAAAKPNLEGALLFLTAADAKKSLDAPWGQAVMLRLLFAGAGNCYAIFLQ
jgi:hypothetical protein